MTGADSFKRVLGGAEQLLRLEATPESEQDGKHRVVEGLLDNYILPWSRCCGAAGFDQVNGQGMDLILYELLSPNLEDIVEISGNTRVLVKINLARLDCERENRCYPFERAVRLRALGLEALPFHKI